MTDRHHSIKPTPELVEMLQDLGNLDAIELAYQAGANWELEACVKWIEDCGFHPSVSENLRAVRRQNLKKQAYDALDTQAPPPEPPTDEELQVLWVEVIARAALERWGK